MGFDSATPEHSPCCLNYFCVAFAGYFRSLFCFLILPGPAAKKHSHMMLPPPRLTTGMVCLWFSSLMAKGSILVSSNQRTSFQLTLESPTCLCVNTSKDLMSFLQQWLSLCHSPIRLWLVKNMSMNVNPCIIKWFYSFLTDRTQNVRINHSLSESRCISTGAPQGSPFTQTTAPIVSQATCSLNFLTTLPFSAFFTRT